MRFEVPQFINVQDKIFGPFTIRQTIYLVGGLGLVYVLYQFLPLFVVIILGPPILGFSLALVFYKPNGRPFIKMVEAYVFYTFTQKFYLWQQRDEKKEVSPTKEIHKAFPQPGDLPDNAGQRISDLAWSLDILDFDQKRD